MAVFTFQEETGYEVGFEAATLEEALTYARLTMRSGDWGEVAATTWVDGKVFDEDGEAHHITEAIHPPAPDCTEDEHEWCSPLSVVGGIKENPGVWGSGGGVVITEVCRHCGHYRVTDTWASRPDTGEQGLRSVAYEAPDWRSTEWIETQAEED